MIAVVGLACRFPASPTVDDFWRNLVSATDCIERLDREALVAAGEDPQLVDDPAFVAASGRIAGADRFDHGFFELSPRDALVANPQQRLFLECAYQALESAGVDPQRYDGLIGVFGGVGRNRYEAAVRAANLPGVDEQALELGNEKDYACPRVSYKLDLRGPSVTVQSACSTGLVAVHQACLSLLNHESDLVVAGAAAVRYPEERGYVHRPGGIASPDGVVRPFDRRANGTVAGDGVGFVALERLEDALAAGRPIYAVVRGSAINNDGRKPGFGQVSQRAQANLIVQAQRFAEVDAGTISYVEGHGTATALGDEVELGALADVFGDRHCMIGSVKSNLGHLREAAGISGFVKTVLALHHGVIPPTLHFERLPERVVGLTVAAEQVDWPRCAAPRRAGVSSFGMGGTNAHIVLEEAPASPPPAEPSTRAAVVLLSARTPESLAAASAGLAEHLADSGARLDDVAYTSQVGRCQRAYRRFVVAGSTEEARHALAAEGSSGRAPLRPADVAFVFPGVGTHYVNMCLGLYQMIPRFRAALDDCLDRCACETGRDLRTLLYPDPERRTGGAPRVDLVRMVRGPGTELDSADVAHPLLFSVSYALAATLAHWGIAPCAVLGHSLGEIVAACVAGVLSLDDAVRLTCRRATLVAGLRPGAMLAVSLTEHDAARHTGKEVWLAAVNGPEHCVLSGSEDAIADVRAELDREGVVHQLLPVRHAFHSGLLEPIAEELVALVTEMELHAPAIPVVSNVTGTWLDRDAATDPSYWGRHLVSTVRFATGAQRLEHNAPVLMEIGPGSLVAWTSQLRSSRAPRTLTLPTVRQRYQGEDDLAFLLGAVARAWQSGVAVDWEALGEGVARRRVPLPLTPLDRRRHSIDAPLADGAATTPEAAATARRAPSEAPIGELERDIAALLGALLGVERLGRHDDVLELGGDSLLWTHVLAFVRRERGIEVPAEVVFHQPTVASIAAAVERCLETEGAVR